MHPVTSYDVISFQPYVFVKIIWWSALMLSSYMPWSANIFLSNKKKKTCGGLFPAIYLLIQMKNCKKKKHDESFSGRLNIKKK